MVQADAAREMRRAIRAAELPEPYFVLSVRRDRVLQDTSSALDKTSVGNLKKVRRRARCSRAASD
jgi:hypothetical protein